MKNSIEEIWKEGFLNEKSLIAPKINNIYSQRSIHLVEQVKRLFRITVVINIIIAMVIPVIYYFIDALWLGVAGSILIFLTLWYGKLQLNGLKMLDQGTTSLDYLKAFNGWLKEIFSRTTKVARLYYTLCFVIALSAIGSAWNKNAGSIPSWAFLIAGLATLVMFYFSDKIYKFDIKLMYGCVFGKLEKTIAEMEELRAESENELSS